MHCILDFLRLYVSILQNPFTSKMVSCSLKTFYLNLITHHQIWTIFSIFSHLKNNLLYSVNKKSYPTCFIIQLIFRVQFNGVKRKGKRSVCDLWMQDIIYLAKISFYECKFHTELSAPFPAGMHQSIYMFSRGIDTWRHA